MENNEIIAAIAMAIHQSNDYNIHDIESGKITIKRHDTEWNAHIFTMTGLPQ